MRFNPNPTVYVTENATQVVIQRCPFCKKKHYHGPSGAAGEQGPDGGHRRAHCLQQDLPDALKGIELGYHLRFKKLGRSLSESLDPTLRVGTSL